MTDENNRVAMRIDVITLFPDMFRAVTDYGISGRAVSNGILDIALCNPREFTTDNHRTVDDRPYGGGPGMVMMVEPLRRALSASRAASIAVMGETVKTVYLSPQGRPVTQALLQETAESRGLILVAGRYEGIDERLIERDIDEEWSIGDYVLSGGEIAAMVVIDGIARLLPGALGDSESARQDSFVSGLLDCPHYTRPEQIDDQQVPEVLLSGNHAQIERWRVKQALGRTWLRRPELLSNMQLSEFQKELLKEFQAEYTQNS